MVDNVLGSGWASGLPVRLYRLYVKHRPSFASSSKGPVYPRAGRIQLGAITVENKMSKAYTLMKGIFIMMTSHFIKTLSFNIRITN